MTTFSVFSKRTNSINGIDIYGANVPEDISPELTYDPFKGTQCTFVNKVTGSTKSIPVSDMFDLIVVPIKNKRRNSFKRLRVDSENDGKQEKKKSLMNMAKVTIDCNTMFSYRICVDRMTYVIMAIKRHALVTTATIHFEDREEYKDTYRINNEVNHYAGHTDLMFDLEL